MIALVSVKLRGTTYLRLQYYGLLNGNCFSVNSHGYVQTATNLTSYHQQVGVPKGLIDRWMSETRDPELDLEKLKKIPKASSFCQNIVYMGETPSLCGNVLCLENLADKEVLFHPRVPLVYTNFIQAREIQDFDGDSPEISECHQRYNWAMKNVKEDMTAKELEDFCGDESLGDVKSIHNRRTLAKVIVDNSKRVIKVWLRRERDLGYLEYPFPA